MFRPGLMALGVYWLIWTFNWRRRGVTGRCEASTRQSASSAAYLAAGHGRCVGRSAISSELGVCPRGGKHAKKPQPRLAIIRFPDIRRGASSPASCNPSWNQHLTLGPRDLWEGACATSVACEAFNDGERRCLTEEQVLEVPPLSWSGMTAIRRASASSAWISIKKPTVRAARSIRSWARASHQRRE